MRWRCSSPHLYSIATNATHDHKEVSMTILLDIRGQSWDFWRLWGLAPDVGTTNQTSPPFVLSVVQTLPPWQLVTKVHPPWSFVTCEHSPLLPP
jgi:hypothetical protein